MSIKIPLSQGKFSIIDDADEAFVNLFKWSFTSVGRGYAVRRVLKPDGRATHQLLHRYLLDPSTGFEVDHIDGDSLNNCRANLRVCTHKQNRANTRKHKDNTSGFKGVCWSKAAQKWSAKLRNKHLGLFGTKEEAALAYDQAAIRECGEFAHTNF